MNLQKVPHFLAVLIIYWIKSIYPPLMPQPCIQARVEKRPLAYAFPSSISLRSAALGADSIEHHLKALDLETFGCFRRRGILGGIFEGK